MDGRNLQRRRLLQASSALLVLPWYRADAQSGRTLSVERRSPAAQARADAEVNGAARHALVIGNGNYRGAAPLKNPANDAGAIAEQLKAAGFQVQLRQDMGRDAMIDAIDAYAGRLAASKAVGLFFFAGHGLQLQWRNFLVPVDARIDKPEDIAAQCVDLGSLMTGITKASNPMNVVVLDACRDNPFTGVKLEAKGLSQFDAPPGTLLAYATSPGNTASDGEGTNGLYTENLLRELKVPEAKIEDVFKRVRLNVRLRSNGQQIPWETTSLEQDFYFLPPRQFRPASNSEVNRQLESELAGWERIKGSRDPAVLQEYLRRYPSGRFSELAQLRLDQVLRAQGENRIRLQAQPTPFSQGLAEADTGYRVGDTYAYRNVDLISRVEQGRVVRGVTRVTDEIVEYSNGEVSDLLGNPLRDYKGLEFLAPQQIFPVQFSVGRRWSVLSRFRGPLGTGEGRVDFAIVKRERITVPAGTFDAFLIEGRGAGFTDQFTYEVERRLWMDPARVRQLVAQEEIRRVPGRPGAGRAERLELVSFSQS